MSISGPVWADETPDRFVLAVGYHNIDDSDREQRPPEVRLEYRAASLPVWKLHPWLGAEFIEDGVGWFGGGLETDIALFDDAAYLTLQTGMGYFDDGNTPGARNINAPTGFEFRHQAEAGIILPQNWRLGLGISHMSNGGIGHNGNAGKNSLTLNVHMPLRR